MKSPPALNVTVQLAGPGRPALKVRVHSSPCGLMSSYLSNIINCHQDMKAMPCEDIFWVGGVQRFLTTVTLPFSVFLSCRVEFLVLKDQNRFKSKFSPCFYSRHGWVCLESLRSGWNLYRHGEWLWMPLPSTVDGKDLPDRYGWFSHTLRLLEHVWGGQVNV